MDPQKLSQLDPKLREAYQRVMGTVIPEPQVAPIQTQAPLPADSAFVVTSAKEAASAKAGTPIQTPQPQQQPKPIPTPNTEPTVPQTPIDQKREPFFIPQPTPTNPEPTPTQQTSNFVQMNSDVPTAPAPLAPTPNFVAPIQTQIIAVKKKNNMLMTTMIGITILVFIVVYGLFWAKIFNFKLPFLP